MANKKRFKISDEEIVNLYKSNHSLNDIAKIAQDTKGTMALRARLISLGVDTSRNMKRYSDKISQAGKKYEFNEHYFDNIDNQDKAYWLGFFAADGYNHESKGCIEFRLHNQDREILEKFKISLNANHLIGLYRTKYCNLCLYSKHLCTTLASYGMVQKKTYILKLPELDNNLMRHFIRGYFDGDGCFSVIARKNRREDSKTYQFTIVGMEDPLTIIQDHLVKNVGVSSLSLKTRKDSAVLTLHYSGKNVCKKLLDYLYYDANLYLKRKHDKYLKYCISA